MMCNYDEYFIIGNFIVPPVQKTGLVLYKIFYIKKDNLQNFI